MLHMNCIISDAKNKLLDLFSKGIKNISSRNSTIEYLEAFKSKEFCNLIVKTWLKHFLHPSYFEHFNRSNFQLNTI